MEVPTSNGFYFNNPTVAIPKPATVAPSIPWRDLNTMPVNFEDLARDFMAHTNPGIVGEVMNLDDFLEELSDPDPKSAVMLNNSNENSNDNFVDGRNTNKKINYHHHQHPPNSLEMMFHAASYHPNIQNNSNNIPNGPTDETPQPPLKKPLNNSSPNTEILPPPLPPPNVPTNYPVDRHHFQHIQFHEKNNPSELVVPSQKQQQSIIRHSTNSMEDISSMDANSEVSPNNNLEMMTDNEANFDHFDPRTRIFTEEELRPVPMLRKRKKQYVADEMKNEKYWEKRTKNNCAARKSREAKRLKENQILLRARFLEEENARLREEARMINEEKASLKTTIENLNDKIRQIVTTRRSSPEISISGSSGSNSTSTFEAVTIRPLPPT